MIKKTLYIQFWYVNNLYACGILQKLSANNFEWNRDTFQFNKDK